MLPAGLYFLGGVINQFNGSKLGRSAYVFLGCSAFEIAQELGLYHGTFDPKDFLAYATGTGLALGIDTITSKKKQDNLEKKLI